MNDEPLPDGFRYEPDFLSEDDEGGLLELIATLPFDHAQYKTFTARRRIVSFGGRYDFSHHTLHAAPPVPESLHPPRDRAARWAEVPADEIAQVLVAEYAPGTPLGWHRDVPDFEAIIGVSLKGACRMGLRHYPPKKPARADFWLTLAPRSIYTLQRAARWQWQHSVTPTKELRHSITFRTRRRHRTAAAPVLHEPAS